MFMKGLHKLRAYLDKAAGYLVPAFLRSPGLVGALKVLQQTVVIQHGIIFIIGGLKRLLPLKNKQINSKLESAVLVSEP